jgi:hypothetical protein
VRSGLALGAVLFLLAVLRELYRVLKAKD